MRPPLQEIRYFAGSNPTNLIKAGSRLVLRDGSRRSPLELVIGSYWEFSQPSLIKDPRADSTSSMYRLCAAAVFITYQPQECYPEVA